MDRRILDRRAPREIEKNLDGELPGLAESGLDGSASRSGDCVKPEEGSDPSGLRGKGREIVASPLGRLGPEFVEVKEPNKDRRRLR